MIEKVQAQLIQEAWQDRGGILTELQGITEGISRDLLMTTDNRLDWPNGERISTENILELYRPAELPVGVHLYLPPALFGGLRSPKEPLIPETRAQQQQLVDAYRSYIRTGIKDEGFSSMYASTDRYTELLPSVLEQLHDNKVSIDRAVWSLYAGAARKQAEQGWCTIDAFVDFRLHSVQALFDLPYVNRLFDSIAKDRYEFSLFSFASRGGDASPADYWFVPIGDYGKPFAEKLLCATALLQQQIDLDLSLGQHIKNEGDVHEDMLVVHTARSRELGAARGLPHTEKEGVLSVVQTIALFTAEHIEGFENAETLLAAIIKEGLIEKFARSVPSGFIGPITNHGNFCKGILERYGDSVRLNPDRMRMFKEAKLEQSMLLAQEWRAYNEIVKTDVPTPPPSLLGLVCPAAMHNGAISNVERSVLHIVQQLE